MQNITFEQLDQAVKASYKLGKMDGEAEIRTQLDDMRRLMANMLTTNIHLHRPLLKESVKTKHILLPPTTVKGILRVLKYHDKPRYNWLKKKYEKQTGRKYE